MSIRAVHDRPIPLAEHGHDHRSPAIFQDLLVLVSSREGLPTPAANVAAALAADWHSSLSVCTLRRHHLPARPEPTVLGMLEVPDEPEHMGATSQDWSRWVSSQGLDRFQLCSPQPSLREAVSVLAPWHDLIVVDQELLADVGYPTLLARVFAESHLPWLSVPAYPVQTLDLRSIAVAWDGSASATRAFKRALPMLQLAEQIRVFDGSESSIVKETGRSLLTPMGYLQERGIAFDIHRIAGHGEAAGATLVRAVRQAGIGLLIMGAFGHSPMRETLFGGVTRHVLADGHVAVWLTS